MIPHWKKLFQTRPDYSALRVFGCACWPNLRPYNAHKLQFRSTQYVFLGYSPMHKGFKCLEVNTDRVYISCDVVFDERIFPFEKVHPNSRALQCEVSLLPHDLLSSTSFEYREAFPNDSIVTNALNHDNPPTRRPLLCDVGLVDAVAAENHIQFGASQHSNPTVIASPLPGMRHKDDSLPPTSSEAGRSSSMLGAAVDPASCSV